MSERLKDLTVKIGSGATPRGGQANYKSFGISLIRSQNVLDFRFSLDGLAFIDEDQAKELESVTVEKGDLLLNITGDSIARVCKVPDEVLPARVNQHVAIVRCKPGIDSNYVLYYLQYLKPYLLKICGVGGTRNALTKEVIENLRILIAENHERIGKVLAEIDEKIELNNRINAELEALAKLIYDYWFVQFDFPISKEQAAAMGNPALEGKPYKSSGGKMVWNEELKREVPEGWEVRQLSSVFDYLEGPGITKEKFSKNGQKFINIRCIVDGDLDVSNASMIGEEFVAQYRQFLLQERDLVLSTSGTLGRSAIVRDEHLPILLNTSVIRFRPKKQALFEFMVLYLKSGLFLGVLNQMATGSIQKNFGPTHLDRMKLVIPSENIIATFHSYSSSLLAKQQVLRSENNQLAKMRDWILPILMNGQVKIKNFEAKVLTEPR